MGAIALVVAACGGSDGVYLEVRVPDGMMVDQVELFLATRACDDQQAGFDCRGIVPPSGTGVVLPTNPTKAGIG